MYSPASLQNTDIFLLWSPGGHAENGRSPKQFSIKNGDKLVILFVNPLHPLRTLRLKKGLTAKAPFDVVYSMYRL
jgi:hypothetical protein